MEEKELNEVKEENFGEESDFADETKPLVEEEPKVEEVKVEEKPEEVGVNLYNEDVEVDPDFEHGQPAYNRKKVPGMKYEYKEPEFDEIEKARLAFSHVYKKRQIVKYIVTGIVLVGVVLGWLLPTFLGDEDFKASRWPMWITLMAFGAMIILLVVYSFLSRKNGNKSVNDYLNRYYSLSNQYAFKGLNIQGLKGTIDDKIEKDELTNSGLYKDVERVGSRGCIHFEYENIPCSLVECSASKREGKNLATLFVGKMLRADNSWAQDPVIVYIKGNKRALPPNNLGAYEVVDDKKDRVIYGTSKKRLLSQKTREAIAKIRTDKVLVDCAIAIQPGTTYILMGYEDSLMVPAFDQPFNPGPTEKFGEDIKVMLEVVETLF